MSSFVGVQKQNEFCFCLFFTLYLFIHLFNCVFVCLFIHLFMYLFLFFYSFIHSSIIHLLIYLFIYSFIYLFIYFLFFSFIYLFIYLFIYCCFGKLLLEGSIPLGWKRPLLSVRGCCGWAGDKWFFRSKRREGRRQRGMAVIFVQLEPAISSCKFDEDALIISVSKAVKCWTLGLKLALVPRFPVPSLIKN